MRRAGRVIVSKLQRCFIPLAISNSDRLGNGIHENLAVAYMTGAGPTADGRDHRIAVNVVNYEFDFDFEQEIGAVLLPPMHFMVVKAGRRTVRARPARAGRGSSLRFAGKGSAESLSRNSRKS